MFCRAAECHWSSQAINNTGHVLPCSRVPLELTGLRLAENCTPLWHQEFITVSTTAHRWFLICTKQIHYTTFRNL